MSLVFQPTAEVKMEDTLTGPFLIVILPVQKQVPYEQLSWP